jgi:hypothetical protein
MKMTINRDGICTMESNLDEAISFRLCNMDSCGYTEGKRESNTNGIITPIVLLTIIFKDKHKLSFGVTMEEREELLKAGKALVHIHRNMHKIHDVFYHWLKSSDIMHEYMPDSPEI